MKINLTLAPDGSQTIVTDEQNNAIPLYLPEVAGGTATGVRPMQMLIMGLGGCAAVDILMILKKQRQEVTVFSIEIEADREKDKEPALWTNAHIVFSFSGKIDESKAQKAIELSMEKYCSVAETLRRAGAELTWALDIKP